MSYLRNAWYVAAWSNEVQPGRTLARTLLDEPVVIYRDAEGRAAALVDRCPHRFAPLSMGRLVERCAAVPVPRPAFRSRPAPACTTRTARRTRHAARVQSYPHWSSATARSGSGWATRNGRTNRRFPSSISSCPSTGSSARGTWPSTRGYELEIDNILDLSAHRVPAPDLRQRRRAAAARCECEPGGRDGLVAGATSRATRTCPFHLPGLRHSVGQSSSTAGSTSAGTRRH